MLCVDVVLTDSDKILLSKRKTEPYKGFWHLPGGVIRKNETLQLALSRVIQTEIGISDFQVTKQLGIFDDPHRDPRGHFITVAFQIITDSSIPEFGPQQEQLAFFKKLPSKLGFDASKIIKSADLNLG